MTAGRRTIALMLVGILATGIWQVGSTQSGPAPVAAPVLNEETENPRVPPPVVRAATKQLSPVRLVPFDSCAPMLKHLRAKARPLVKAWGIEGIQSWFGFGDDVVMGRALAATSGAPAEPAPAMMPAPRVAGITHSTTNVQEEGVDEPDLVKTDGKILYSIARGRLYAVDVTGSRPRPLGSIGVAQSNPQMLLAGDRAMVFSNEYPNANSSVEDLKSLTHVAISIVDVSNPSKMYVVDRVRVEGWFVSARLVDGVARIVTRSNPIIPLPQVSINGPKEEKAAIARNRRVLQKTGLDGWLPNYRLEHGGRATASGVAVPCNRVSRPMTFAGLGMTTVMTIDPSNPKPKDASTVNADADVVYATSRSLYVTASRWIDPSRNRLGLSLMSTQIHKFDISQPGPARYLASGVVRGHILKQWSLSEHEGFLRVATTDNASAVGNPVSESFVIVMQQRGDELVRIAAVRGLGKGETIQGVRFIGDLGYIVTWRVIDPLYVMDLRNPWKPKVTGELKIPGFSAYLHPVGKDRLLGIGRGGTMEGRITGIKASLFNISDPKKPREITSLMLDSAGASSVEVDHHAFLWWPQTKLAFVPMWNEAVGIRVDDDKLVEIRRVSHMNRAKDVMWHGEIQRAVVIDDSLLTTSNLGVLDSDLRSLAERTWMGWAS